MTATTREPLERSPRLFACSECSATAYSDQNRRGCGLPRGWEHYTPLACRECVSTTAPRPPAEYARPVCAECVPLDFEARHCAGPEVDVACFHRHPGERPWPTVQAIVSRSRS